MPYSLVLPDNYGYVVLVALGLTPVLSFAQGNVVTGMRKSAKVPYPNAYASPQDAKDDQDKYKFNCAQRSHANLLENMPQTIMYMLFSGLEYPIAASALGLAWVGFRAVYAMGYIRSGQANGKGRLYGSGFWLVQGLLWGLSGATALKML